MIGREPPTIGVAAVALATLLAGCTLASSSTPSDASGGALLPPPGFGTLSQREVSLSLRSGDLQILVTPLSASVLVATAPDTYRRLDALAAPYRTSDPDVPVFLVSFFSDQPEVRFVPEEVQFVSRGIRARPATIHPMTPGWGSGRLAQRETESALYLFDRPVDLESDLMLHYGLEQSGEWSSILSRIQAERARARARAGITGR